MSEREHPPRRRRRSIKKWIFLGLIVFLIYGWIRLGSASAVPDDAVLLIDLRSDIPEENDVDFLSAFRTPPLDISTLRDVLDEARLDPRVRGVLLRVSSSPFGLGRVEEIAELLGVFRQSKPVVSYADSPDTLGYVLACAAQEIWLDPSSVVFLNGLHLSAFFLEDALGKWGIEVDLERIGDFKGAYEQFKASAASKAFDESMNSLADSLFGVFVRRIAAARSVSEEKVRRAIDSAPFGAEEATTLGFADRLVARHELVDKVRERFGQESELVDASLYALELGAFPPTEHRVAYVRVSGMILEGGSESGPLNGSAAGSDTIIQALEDARRDSTIRAVLLRIDSPGGSASASEKIWQQVRRTAEIKPVVASLGETAASGGYYIASAANWIVAQPGTITGSIGIFGGKVVIENLLRDQKIGVARYSRGANAGFFDSTRRFTDSEREKLKAWMREGYETFVRRVAEGRKKSFEEIEALAEGRVWSGAQALVNGLVDAEGGIEISLGKIRGLTGIPLEARVNLVPFPPRPGIFDWLSGPGQLVSDQLIANHLAAIQLGDGGVTNFRTPGGIAAILGQLERLTFLDARSPLALLPFRLSTRTPR